MTILGFSIYFTRYSGECPHSEHGAYATSPSTLRISLYPHLGHSNQSLLNFNVGMLTFFAINFFMPISLLPPLFPYRQDIRLLYPLDNSNRSTYQSWFHNHRTSDISPSLCHHSIGIHVFHPSYIPPYIFTLFFMPLFPCLYLHSVFPLLSSVLSTALMICPPNHL